MVEEADTPPPPLGEVCGRGINLLHHWEERRIVKEADKPPPPLEESESAGGGIYTFSTTGKRVVEEADKPSTPLGGGEGGGRSR